MSLTKYLVFCIPSRNINEDNVFTHITVGENTLIDFKEMKTIPKGFEPKTFYTDLSTRLQMQTIVLPICKTKETHTRPRPDSDFTHTGIKLGVIPLK